MTRMSFWDWVVLLLLVSEFKHKVVLQVEGQQSYVNNLQLDCNKHSNATDGYLCNGAASCRSYLTFRSLPPYNSPTSIAYLLGSTPVDIAAANNVSDVDPIPIHTQILVPVNCSCSSNYYQHNSSYVLKSSDTYFSVANDTYQGLTTCQSLMAQNPFGETDLTVGLNLQVPVRCACPTRNQTAAGVKFLLAYMVTWGDDPSLLAQRFRLDLSTLLQANRLSSIDIIYPFTPILVPLIAQPSPTLLQVSSPPPSPPADSPTAPPGNSSSNNNNNKWIFVGVGVGAACLLLFLTVIAFLLLRRRRRLRHGPRYPSSSPNSKLQVSSAAAGKSSDSDYLNMPISSDTKSWSSTAISSRGLHYAVDSLTVYKLEELQRATQFFREANRIQGSVFRGSFDGDEAAIKVMKGDVSLSADEINLLKRINHSNIIRLSGFCVHQAHTYLVYEYAPAGSLADSLHAASDHQSLLSWKQRVQIAHDVADALNYLHNFTHPPYIHKNLKSSNILLDANLRAKVSNFGLARALQGFGNNNSQDYSSQERGGGLQLTRHVVGTHGYMAPEYIQNGVITPKLDVFAFGVVLLELLSGREAAADDIDKKSTNGASLRSSGGDHQEPLLSASISGVLEGDHVRDKLQGFMDPSLKRDYPLDLAFSMAQLAKRCVAPQINSRPTMGEVFNTLSKILSSTLDCDPSDDSHQLLHSSSTRSR